MWRNKSSVYMVSDTLPSWQHFVHYPHAVFYSFSKEPSPHLPQLWGVISHWHSVSLQHSDRSYLCFQGVTHGDTPMRCLCVDHSANTECPPEAAATLDIPEANALRSLRFQQPVLTAVVAHANSPDTHEAKEEASSETRPGPTAARPCHKTTNKSKRWRWGIMVTHAFSPRIWETEASSSL